MIAFAANAQVLYFIPSGHSPEESNTTVTIIVKDNSGQLWVSPNHSIISIKNNLLKNRDFYVEAFNNGTHYIPASYAPFSTVKIADAKIDENYIRTKYSDLYFHRLIVLQRTQKSIVCKYEFGSGFNVGSSKYAFSLDLKKMVYDPDVVNPLHYTSFPVDRFIVRRSIDDLF